VAVGQDMVGGGGGGGGGGYGALSNCLVSEY